MDNQEAVVGSYQPSDSTPVFTAAKMELPSTNAQILETVEAMKAVASISQSGFPPQQKPYVSQFSSVASLVLRRLKDSSSTANGESSNNSAPKSPPDQTVNGNIKTEVTEPMVIDHVDPGLATTNAHLTLSLAPGPRSATSSSLSAGVKRKRSAPIEDVDFTQSTIPLTWDDKSEDQSVGTHRQLRSRVEEGNEESNESPRLRSRIPRQDTDGLERLRQKRLAALPGGAVPAKPELVGFGAGRASDSARLNYFSGIKRTDLLNVLSFCDQLKPGLLVDIMVSVSKKHPNLPLFGSPDWEAHVRSTKSTRTDNKPRHGHTLLNKARPRPKATKKILKRTRVIEVVADAPGLDEDVLPPTWAKANEGMYAKLPPETEDRLFLLDENDEESFSHFFVDGFGKQIVEPVGA